MTSYSRKRTAEAIQAALPTITTNARKIRDTNNNLDQEPSIVKWKETRGTELMFGGQGKQEDDWGVGSKELQSVDERSLGDRQIMCMEFDGNEPQQTSKPRRAAATAGDEPSSMRIPMREEGRADDESLRSPAGPATLHAGLKPPCLLDGRVVDGALKRLWKRETKKT